MIVKCPTCKQPVSYHETATRPFCSERCRLLDLGKWLSEEYRVEVVETDEDETTGPDASARLN